jgi:hypothetical protein
MIEYNSPDFWEAYEERAAIMEYDAPDVYATRRDAERAAYRDATSQCKDTPHAH